MAEVILKHVRKIYKDAIEPAAKDQKIPLPSSLQITPEGVVAVQDFCMEIKDKEFIVLVGPSGCGKSTTLRMIAGLEDITAGDLYIGDERVNDLAPKQRDISMVFQNYALYPHMTVFENMAFPLKLRKLPKDEIRRKVEQAAAILDITNQLTRKPKALSGGQRQRVAIGRAIVRNPKVLLMDEPLSNLDAKLRTQMRTEIMKLRKVINTTFIYVTHDQVEAMTLGDRIVVMKDGYIQQIGTPQEVFHHPKNLFVAGFIGTPQMNFFDAELREENGSICAVIEGKTFPISEEKQQKLREMENRPEHVIAGIRPVYIHPDTDGIAGTVEISEQMGSEVQLHVKTGEKEVRIVLPTVDMDEKDLHNHGNTIHYTFRPDLICYFNKETEENVF